MNIAVIGLNHDTASIEIRDKVAFTDNKKIEAVNILLDKGIGEVVILSTCNRNEIYISCTDYNLNESIITVINFYKNYFNINEIEKHLYVKESEEAINHLYKVSCGLDSIVLGEDQILGQVKDAHEFSLKLGSSKKILNKLFREAVSTAKKIKTNLKISDHPLSISYIGIKFLKEKMKTFSGKNVLVIGLGKMGKLALNYLLEENVENLYVTNRSHQKIIDVIKEFPQVNIINYSDRYDKLSEIDILISATACPHTIITFENITERNKDLHILDLAMPKDIDKNVGLIDKVSLYDIDDLKNISDKNKKRREELSKEALKIVKSDVDDFKSWLVNIEVDPVIKSLKKKCESIEKDTLEYIFNKIDLDNREKKIIEKMLSSALKRVIREPILNLKNLDDNNDRQNIIRVAENLFNAKVS